LHLKTFEFLKRLPLDTHAHTHTHAGHLYAAVVVSPAPLSGC